MDLKKKITQQNVLLKDIVYEALHLTCKYSYESEISIIKTTGITVSTRLGKVENIEFNDNEMLTITIFIENKKGVASSNNLNRTVLLDTFNKAVNIARYTSENPHTKIADKELLAFDPICLDLCHPIDLDVKLGIRLSSQAENAALRYDNRIICTEGGVFNSYYTTRVFGNSHGMLNSYNSSQHMLSCSVVAENNGMMEQNYSYTLSRKFNELKSPNLIGQESARRALDQLGSKKIKTMESPVLFSAETSVSLFKHLACAIHGDNVCRQSTFLFNNLGLNILPSWISVKEFPHIPAGLGSSPFDNEGVKTKDRIIIDHGILNNWLLDTYSAHKIGLKSTGHAGGIYNWYISVHNINFLELVKKMYRGLIITNLMGQGVNIVTGDYSRGITGFWVEKGEIQYPVNEVTISGNLKNMFLNIIDIGNDIEIRSNIRCGSVLIDSLKIAGI